MGLKEEVIDMKKEIQEVQEHSFAFELLKDQKKQNKRMFIIIIILIVMLALAMTYIVFLLNDIGTSTETDTIDIDNVETIDNSHIKIGDDIWEKSK